MTEKRNEFKLNIDPGEINIASNPNIPSLEPPVKKHGKRKGDGGTARIMEEKTGVSRNDPNFESHVRDQVSSNTSAEAHSVLYLLKFEKSITPRIKRRSGTFVSHSSRELEKKD